MRRRDAWWRDRAACKGLARAEHDPWYPQTPGHRSYSRTNTRQARTICASCPVQRECFTMAMNLEHGKSLDRRYGVFAGTSPSERYLLDGGEPGQQYRRVPLQRTTRPVAPTLCQSA